MSAFEIFAREYATYGYPVLFLGVLLENMGIPVPGETAVLVAGFLANPSGPLGVKHLDIFWVIGLTVVAAVIGDNVGFWLGQRWARPRLQQGKRFLFLTPRTLELAEGYFNRYGVWTIFCARFITGLRVVGALAAGTAGMRWSHFLAANAAGALAWAVTMSLLGFFFGHSLDLVHKYIGGGGVIILGCIVVLIALPVLLRRLRRMKPEVWERLLNAQVWHGVAAALLVVLCIALLVTAAHHPRDPEGAEGRRVDREVEGWVGPAREAAPLATFLARWGGYVGGLPVMLAVVGLMGVQLCLVRRPWREFAAILWSFAASEALGLLLLNLLRHRGIDPEFTLVWPYGFVGLAPMCAIAVLGMAAYVLSRQNARWGRIAKVIALCLIAFIGTSVVWTGEQHLTEVLLELAAGGVVLFTGVWWLEGYVTLFPGQRRLASEAANPAPSAAGSLEQTASGSAGQTSAR